MSESKQQAVRKMRFFRPIHGLIDSLLPNPHCSQQKIFYCVVTASSRTEHVRGGDIALGINGESLYTNPDNEVSFTTPEQFFDSFVIPKVQNAKAPRTVRFIRFFRKIYRGRYVAPRDAKLSHVEATYIFNKSNLRPEASYNVGKGEPVNGEEDDILLQARDRGDASIVFDVVFPDEESLGVNLWSNVLEWQSSLGAADSTPVIQTGTRRVLPSSMAGAAPAPPPFMRGNLNAASASATKSSPSVTKRATLTPSTHPETASTSSPVIIRPTSAGHSPTPSPQIDNSTLFSDFVDPLVARRESRIKNNTGSESFPRPSDTAGSTLAPPPFIRRAGFPAGPGQGPGADATAAPAKRLMYAGPAKDISSPESIPHPHAPMAMAVGVAGAAVSEPPSSGPSGVSDFDDGEGDDFGLGSAGMGVGAGTGMAMAMGVQAGTGMGMTMRVPMDTEVSAYDTAVVKPSPVTIRVQPHTPAPLPTPPSPSRKAAYEAVGSSNHRPLLPPAQPWVKTKHQETVAKPTKSGGISTWVGVFLVPMLLAGGVAVYAPHTGWLNDTATPTPTPKWSPFDFFSGPPPPPPKPTGWFFGKKQPPPPPPKAWYQF